MVISDILMKLPIELSGGVGQRAGCNFRRVEEQINLMITESLKVFI